MNWMLFSKTNHIESSKYSFDINFKYFRSYHDSSIISHHLKNVTKFSKSNQLYYLYYFVFLPAFCGLINLTSLILPTIKNFESKFLYKIAVSQSFMAFSFYELWIFLLKIHLQFCSPLKSSFVLNIVIPIIVSCYHLWHLME